MEVGIRVETEYSRSYTEDIILDIDIIQIWKRRYFSRPLSVPFLFLYFVPQDSHSLPGSTTHSPEIVHSSLTSIGE